MELALFVAGALAVTLVSLLDRTGGAIDAFRPAEKPLEEFEGG